MHKLSPIKKMELWLKEAKNSESHNHNACALATTDEHNCPQVRMVLVKQITKQGHLVFFTNLESPKALQIEHNPNGAMCFYWKSLNRQLRIAGTIKPCDPSVAKKYFSTRSRESQIIAFVSRQSSHIEDPKDFDRAIEQCRKNFQDKPIPLPQHWGGFYLTPKTVEFWEEGPARNHKREAWILNEKYQDGQSHQLWQIISLQP